MNTRFDAVDSKVEAGDAKIDAKIESLVGSLRQEMNARFNETLLRFDELRRDFNRAQFNLASHEHIGDRVISPVRADDESALAAAD